MRKLIDTPNIGAATTDFPDGVIRDNAGAIVGTALTEILYGDIIQMVHKLKRLAGITENNLPDNETNGFQLITSLFAQSLPTWKPLSAKVDFSKSKWVSYANGIYYHKTTVSTDTTPNLDTTNWFRVFYWDGTKIIFSDEARIAGIESDITTIENDIAPLLINVSPTDLVLGSGYLWQMIQPKVVRKGDVIMASGDFYRSSGSGVLVATLPVGCRPTRDFVSLATYRTPFADPKIIPIIVQSTGSISIAYAAAISSSVEIYDFCFTFVI